MYEITCHFNSSYYIILDCANQGPNHIRSKGYPHSSYITLNSPLLKNIDQHGLITGTMKNISELVKYNIPISESKACVKWGFFTPSQTGIKVLEEFVENGKVSIHITMLDIHFDSSSFDRVCS